MPCKLTEAQVAQYRRDGFCFPVPVFFPEEVIDLRKQLEIFETRQGHVLQGIQRLKTSLLLTWVDRLIRAPQILDPVADLMGPNILCWGVHFWIKESKTIDYVSWHQDHQYWGLDSAKIVTAWVALSPATIESGCMRMQPGSHTAHLPHQDLFDRTNMLSRGQTITEVTKRGGAYHSQTRRDVVASCADCTRFGSELLRRPTYRPLHSLHAAPHAPTASRVG